MENPGRRIRLRSSARTNVGQVRENNEDSVHLWAQEDVVLAIVADGMGGAVAGEEASRLAVEAIQHDAAEPAQPILGQFDNMAADTIGQKLRDIIRIANQDIMQRAADEPRLRGMGTTVTLAFLRDLQAIVAHVGDSRAYHVSRRGETITQITADHSFVEALVAAGHITPEQAEEHPMRNVLYRALGQTSDLDIDIYHSRMGVGDWLVLCSDGLTRHVKSTEIAAAALGTDDPDVVSQSLIDLANERGGEDNVSVVAILVEGDEPDELNDNQTLLLEHKDDDDDDEDTLLLTDDDSLIDTLHARPVNEFHDENKIPPGPHDTQELPPLAPDPLDRAITERSDLPQDRANQSPGASDGHDDRAPDQ